MEQTKRQSMTKKIQIVPVGDKEERDRAYQYIRQAMYVQNKAYNILISHVYATITAGKMEEVAEIYKRGARKPKDDDPDYSLYKAEDFTEIPVGLPLFANTAYIAKGEMNTAKSKGLYKGKVSLQNRKLDAPVYVNKKFVQITHYHKDYNEFCDKLYTNELDMGFDFANGIQFKLKLGSLNKSRELRATMANIIEENYIIQDSSIQFDRTGKKIMLNLTLSIPYSDKKDLKDDVCVGVHYGTQAPVTVALNIKPKNGRKDYQHIGDTEEIERVSAQIKGQRRSIRNHMKSVNGGHGTTKRMQALERLESRYRNFSNTYSHYMSKQIVKFAVDNKAKYIFVEDTAPLTIKEEVKKKSKAKGKTQEPDTAIINATDSNKEETVVKSIKRAIGEWQFFKMNEQIKYKAKAYGIEVLEGMKIENYDDTLTDYDYAKMISMGKK